ncbi:recombinase RecF, partial [Variovorax sp. CAN2819]|nr:recombinase RecF [Variovorax sp. CAN15]
LAVDLAPDGIPGQMLAEALEPINTRLQQSAVDAEWLRVGIDADMSITCMTPSGGARPYALLSESERWRVDAMVAEAISFQSGVKLLVLDRFDVLDAQGRGDLLAWLDVLAQNGEIETALLFGTLKALPSDLPATVAAEWINNGHVGQLKEAA